MSISQAIRINNFLWVDKLNVVAGLGTNQIASSREVDCFDQVTISLTYSGNASLATIAAVITWYDEWKNLLFTDSVSSALAATSVSSSIPIKGAYASLTLTGPADVGLTYNFVANLIVFNH
jgi:hypothetical protein